MKTSLWTLFFLGVCASCGQVFAEDWPQWQGAQRDAVWRETGIIDKFPAAGPNVRWRIPIGGGYAGPAVANGKVVVTDRILAEGAKNPANAFAKDLVPGTERILCLDESNGKEIWKHEYDCPYNISYGCGPRATPIIADGKVFAQGAEGNLFCLSFADGKVIWSKDFQKDYSAKVPMWGFSGHPLLDGKKLICLVGGPSATVVAFDKDTGNEIWKSLNSAEPGYAAPMIYEFAGMRQLIMWTPESVNGLDPETGKPLWSQPFMVKANLSIPTPRKSGDYLFVSAFYNGSMLLKPEKDKVSVVWRGKSNSETKTDGLHSIMPTPFIEDGYIYGVCSYGEFRCLKLETGERVWESLKPTGAIRGASQGAAHGPDRWKNAFIVKNGDKFFLPNEAGDLIIAKLTPKGYEELSRAHLLEPTTTLGTPRPVNWSHPAFANKSVYARNDKEIVCVGLGK